MNVFVFGINAYSVLNDIGMMFLSGMCRKILLESPLSSWIVSSKKSGVAVEPELLNTAGDLIINSRAYEE